MSNTVPFRPQRRPDWRGRLMANNKGVPLGNLHNVLLALREAPEWAGVLAYDEFAGKVVTKKPPPWSDDGVINQWLDQHETEATAWFQRQGINAAVGVVGRAIQRAARQSPFHPVRDYLDGLTWDRTPRLDTWLTTYLGVEESEYVRAVGPRYLISAVARIFQPGCQVDHMLILEGSQGVLKSSALRVLAEPWFTDRLSTVGTKDAAMEVAGVWLIELSELDALTRAGTSAIKSFVTRRHDRLRPPYGKHVTDHPRQCLFAGTINPEGGYLKDPTGARRFWPVACGVVDLQSLERARGQIWAEAVHRFRAGAHWWLDTPELEALAAAEQAARFASDAWEDPIRVWIGDRDDVSVGEVLVGALGRPRESWSQPAQNRVAKILVHMGFQKHRSGSDGARQYRYRRDVAIRTRVEAADLVFTPRAKS
jgi:putative DNA primase/helicase